MINLNDEKFDGGGNSGPIFNGGVAGIVENVTLSVEKKKADDHENAPDYKLMFTDENGATCNSSYWFITEATSFNTVDELILKQGKVLKHVIHAIYGSDYELPTWKTPEEMLNGAMKLIRDGLKAAPKFRMFANYNVKSSPKQYIQPRSWVPFMEPMDVASEDSRLRVSDLDQMERITEDKVSAPAATVADDEEW